MVVVHHYANRLPGPKWYTDSFSYTGLWGGVDLFFAISGYVISKSLLDRHPNLADARLSASEMIQFWIKRVFRLLPSAWLWLAIPTILSPFFVHTGGMQIDQVLRGAASAFFIYSNFYWEYCVRFSLMGTSCPWPDANGVYWSLSAEEQFYIVLSSVLLFTRLRYLLLVALPLAFGIWLIPSIAAWHWHLRYESLVTGVAVYAFSRTSVYAKFSAWFSNRMVRRALILGCCVGIALAKGIAPGHEILFLTVLATASVALGTVDGAFENSRMGLAIGWMGDRAYSIYLSHLTVYLIAREALIRLGFEQYWSSGSFALIVFPVVFVAVLLLGDASHRFVDKPTTEFGKRLAAAHRGIRRESARV